MPQTPKYTHTHTHKYECCPLCVEASDRTAQMRKFVHMYLLLLQSSLSGYKTNMKCKGAYLPPARRCPPASYLLNKSTETWKELYAQMWIRNRKWSGGSVGNFKTAFKLFSNIIYHCYICRLRKLLKAFPIFALNLWQDLFQKSKLLIKLKFLVRKL